MLYFSRKAFEQAKKVPGCIFGLRGGNEIEKIKQSKYFRALLQQSNGMAVNELVLFTASSIILTDVLFLLSTSFCLVYQYTNQNFYTCQGDQSKKAEKLNSIPLKTKTQVKLTSMYRNNTTKGNDGSSRSSLTSGSNVSEDCIMVERPLSFHNQNKGQSSSPKIEEEERAYGNTFRTKRSHTEINSPSVKHPLSNEDANNDTSGNGFVTAKAKLVILFTFFFFWVPCQASGRMPYSIFFL